MNEGWRLNEKAQTNTDRPSLSPHCHYFAIIAVGASLCVLQIMDKGLGGDKASTQAELKPKTFPGTLVRWLGLQKTSGISFKL